MEYVFYLVLLAVAGIGVAAIFSPKVRQALRIWGNKGVNNATTAVDRAKDRVRQAEAKLPGVRENVARLMTAAQNAQTAVTDKKAEAEELLTKYSTAKNMNASAQTQETLKLRWKTAKDAIPGLETAATAAAQEAEDAQKELEDYIQIIAESEAGVQKLEADATLAEIYRASAANRQALNDMKKGLGANGEDAKQVRDELQTAKNANELSKGSAADREMAEIERKAKANSADDEIEAALAARNGGQK
jgi:chromosome segregation ATPase